MTPPLAPTGSISAQHITKRFGSQGALNNLNLTINCGERVLLLGANGAGKSTLLRILAGLARCDDGEVRIDGQPRGTTVSSQIGYVGHQTLLYPCLSVRENIELFAALAGADSSSTDLLSRWQLDNHAERMVGELSRGLQFRVSLARALVAQPRFILLDEPSAALDEEALALLIGNLQSAALANSAIIIATHDIRRLASIATRVVVMRAGHIQHDSANTSSLTITPEIAISLYIEGGL